jgi:hypothetical protein
MSERGVIWLFIKRWVERVWVIRGMVMGRRVRWQLVVGGHRLSSFFRIGVYV